MSKHKHISVKSYYQRAKVFGYLTLIVAVILVIVVGTLRLIGGNANNVFSSVASSLQ